MNLWSLSWLYRYLRNVRPNFSVFVISNQVLHFFLTSDCVSDSSVCVSYQQQCIRLAVQYCHFQFQWPIIYHHFPPTLIRNHCQEPRYCKKPHYQEPRYSDLTLSLISQNGMVNVLLMWLDSLTSIVGFWEIVLQSAQVPNKLSNKSSRILRGASSCPGQFPISKVMLNLLSIGQDLS